jgi:hypothetical protein
VCQHEIGQKKIGCISQKIIKYMPHVLGFAVEYKKYLGDAVIRIFSDDHLVEELVLDQDINVKTVLYNKEWVLGFDLDPTRSYNIDTPEKIFLFHIDEKYLCDNIRIEVNNDNSNYSNGFMSKWSYINIHSLFLIPDFMLEGKNWLVFWHRFNGKIPSTQKDGRALSRRWPPHPLPDHKIELVQTNNPWEGDFLGHARGGSYSIKIPLSRKHKIIHLGKPRPGFLRIHIRIALLLRVYKVLNTKR